MSDKQVIDKLCKEHRAWNMSRIRSKDTKPEKIVRSMLHKMGYRFRLHKKNLPGVPDIVLRKYRTVIFVHGCFWHRHINCKYAYYPKSRTEFWSAKFKINVERDKEVKKQLQELGWKVITIWECEMSSTHSIQKVLADNLPKQEKHLVQGTD